MEGTESISTQGAPAETPAAFLSLVIIVRDAEDSIGALLDSVAQVDGVDEIVIVDTGSADKTREIIVDRVCAEQHCEATTMERFRYENDGEGHEYGDDSRSWRSIDSRWVLDRYDWIDDFAAARNYAFSLATGAWRMYLDADDVLECRHPAILAGEKRADGTLKRFDLAHTIRIIASRRPDVNAISLPYEYVIGDAQQDVYRIFRWADGWKWRDAVHENLISEPPMAHQRVVTLIPDAVVVHRKHLVGKVDDRGASFERNRRIIDRELARDDLPQDSRERLSFALCQDFRRRGDLDGLVKQLELVTNDCRGSNYDVIAHRELVQTWSLDLRERPHSHDKAVDFAGRLISRFPELVDGYASLGWAYVMAEQFERAAKVFDHLALSTKMPWSTSEALWFNDGAVPSARALAYARTNRIEDAERALADVKAHAIRHHAVLPLYSEARRALTRRKGGIAAVRYAEYLLETQQPREAARFLQRAATGALEHERRALATHAREINRRLEHLQDFDAYQSAYASLPDDLIHSRDVTPEAVLSSARAKLLLAWAEEQSKGPASFRALFVGVQDGYLEAQVLRACPQMTMVIAEIVPNARAVRQLVEEFPSRVLVHEMKDLNDWGGVPSFFDAAVAFEVIEHVPDPKHMLSSLHRALKPDGHLFLSTPAADRWADPQLARDMPAFFAHVKSYGPTEFALEVALAAFDGEITEGFDGTLVFHGTRLPRTRESFADPVENIAIFVPEGVTPFDPYSLHAGHLGGSEEAVIHLAKALAAKARVTVYAPRGKLYDAGHVVMKDGVIWRETEEFDWGGRAHDVVLFWRCPNAMEQKGLGAYRKVLWLHDSYYGAPARAYARADAVVALSGFHADVLVAKDHASRKNVVVLQNGIDPSAFPEPDESARDPLRVIYTSSPDRGLPTLLDLWPRIQAAVPGASLRIYYDWKNASWLKPELVDGLKHHLEFLAQYEVPRVDGEGFVKMDVAYEGGVSHDVLHEIMRKAGVLAYPHNAGDANSDGPSPETFCITLVKAAAAGCFPVTTDVGALPEVICGGVAVHFHEGEGDAWKDDFVHRVVDALELGQKGLLGTDRIMMRERALNRFSWEKTAARFLAEALAPK